MTKRFNFALSTNKDDHALTATGLNNTGLVGYLEPTDSSASAMLECYQIRYREGIAYLYTMDTANESVAIRSSTEVFQLGYARSTPSQGYHLLRRFFLSDHQSYAYIPTPLKLSLKTFGGLLNESDQYPLYVKTTGDKDDLPLFLYSNYNGSEGIFLETPKRMHKSDFMNRIKIKNLSLGDFSITDGNDSSVIIENRGGLFVFSVTPKTNGYFVVLRPSLDLNKSYILLESEVYAHFDLWIDEITAQPVISSPELNEHPPLDPEVGDTDTKYYEYPNTRYRFRYNKFDPALDVVTQATIFCKLLDAISPEENGLLLGIFGRWGRGKTYFWKQLTSLFENRFNEKNFHGRGKDGPLYIPVEFHAWKYQDTPASWAYLFETCVTNYYKQKRRLWLTGRYFKAEWLNKLLLNTRRFGYWKSLGSLAAIIFGLVWCFLISLETKGYGLLKAVSFIGLGTSLSIASYYFFYSQSARKVVKKYFSDVGFSHLLGLQSEIQGEFKHLFGEWVPKRSVGEKRIIIFVDDIDRCSEDRIIQVIDSLKVMMDDPFFSERAIIIAAVDETVLKRAIKAKYSNMITHDLSINGEQASRELERICREYMDKLFINGFKLGNLSTEEKKQILKKYTDGRVHSHRKDTSTTNMEPYIFGFNAKRPFGYKEHRKDTSAEDLKYESSESKSETEFATKLTYLLNWDEPDDKQKKGTNAFTLALEDTLNTENTEHEISEFELENLMKTIQESNDATPRSIRIFYFRYLLARDFRDIILKNNEAALIEWKNLRSKELLPFLILEYGVHQGQENLNNKIRDIESIYNGSSVDFHLFNQRFTVSKGLALILMKVVEIVIPY